MGFIQNVCPLCGNYVIAPLNGAMAWECSSLACGWRGNYSAQVNISYSDNTATLEKEKPVSFGYVDE